MSSASAAGAALHALQPSHAGAVGLLCAALLGPGSLAAQRVEKEPAPPGPDTAWYAIVAGGDTLARETVVRTPRTLTGELRVYRPRAVGIRYVMYLGTGATVDSLETTSVDGGVASSGRIVIRRDSAVLTMQAPGLTGPQVHRIAVVPGALPFINLSAGALDQIFRRARHLGGDSVAVPLVAGPQLLTGEVRFVGADSAVLDLGVELRAAVERDGAFRGAIVPAQNVRFVRLAAPPARERAVPEAERYGAPDDAPYTAEQVRIRTADGGTLAGTLTLPTGTSTTRRAPVVVTISGSGAQDRDAALPGIAGYRPFREIADTLGRRGIGVLRLDDRGAGASTATADEITSAGIADDVRAALAWLRARRDVAGDRLGLLGHSEGGIVAPIVAAEDSALAGVALLAAPSRPGAELSAHQRRIAIVHDPRIPVLARDSAFRIGQAQADSMIASGGGTAWTRFWWTFDPRPVVRRVRVPVLVLHGETDRQVPAAQGEELAAALRAAGNADVTLRRIPGVNHLLLEDPSGYWGGYMALPSKALPPAVLGVLADWFAARLGPAR